MNKCPSCFQPVEAIPTRSGTCIHCKQKYFRLKDPDNGEYVFTNSEGKRTLEKKKQRLIDLENSRNNTANFKEVMKYSRGVKKEWKFASFQTEHCKTHKNYESLGSVPLNYEYAPGLKYPGDPNCKDPKEVEGCTCFIVYEN